MSTRTFTKGTRIWVDGRAATVLDGANSAAAVIAFDGASSPEKLDLLALYARGVVRWDAPAATAPEPAVSLEQIPETAWNEARQRVETLRPLLDATRSDALVKSVAASASVSARTVYRWLHAYDQDGLRGLLPDTAKRGAPGKPRLKPDRDQLLAEAIREFYLRRTRPSQRHAFAQIAACFREKGLAPPGFHTFRARIEQMNAAQRSAARDGTKQARRHHVSRGSFPDGKHALQTVLVDHTPLDIQLVDDSDRTRVIGRPYLTLAIDAHTRMVFGYYLSLDPPSYLSVAMCLLQGVLPKDDIVRRFSLAQAWPIHGLPEAVHTDNGKDFRSKHLERFAAQYELTLAFRPVRTPHYGGIIERVIGTVNRFVHPLPGTTKSSVAAKGDYDSEGGALFTLDEIEEFLARRIVEFYHAQPHRELGKSPLEAWNEAVNSGFAPCLPEEPDRFLIDLLPYEERTIQKDGLALFGLHYTDGVLQTWRSREGTRATAPTYVVKYDPRDLSKVYFMPPDGGAPLTIPVSNRTLGVFSLLELRRTQMLAKASNRAWSERVMPEFLQRERAALAEAEKKSKAARRDAARIRKSRAATAPAKPSPVVAKPIEPIEPVAPTPPPTSAPSFDANDDWGLPVLRM